MGGRGRREGGKRNWRGRRRRGVPGGRKKNGETDRRDIGEGGKWRVEV